jgi:hypothetical protein
VLRLIVGLIPALDQLTIDNYSHVKNVTIALSSLLITILLMLKSKIILPYH